MTDKITIDRALLEQALEALDADPYQSESVWVRDRRRRKAVTDLRSALREAALQRLTDVQQEMEQPQQERPYLSPKLRAVLEQPQQEPVAWLSHSRNLLSWDKFFDDMEPLYTSPPAPRTAGEAEDGKTEQYTAIMRDAVTKERDACAKVCEDFMRREQT